MPRRSTAVIDGTIDVTTTPAAGPSSSADTAAKARRGPRRQAWATSCSRSSAEGVPTRCTTRVRATTAPSASTATAFTEVVPTSTPMVQPAPSGALTDLTISS